jgi:putative zinc finger/helix-turn-helix YgiT family protein
MDNDKMHKCPTCGKHDAWVSRGIIEFKESGLRNVWLEGVPILQCACGERLIGIPDLKELLDLVAKKILLKENCLSGEEIRFLRKRLLMSTKEFSQLLGVARETLSRWENENRPPNATADRLIRVVYGQKMNIDPEIMDEVTSKVTKFEEELVPPKYVIQVDQLKARQGLLV